MFQNLEFACKSESDIRSKVACRLAAWSPANPGCVCIADDALSSLKYCAANLYMSCGCTSGVQKSVISPFQCRRVDGQTAKCLAAHVPCICYTLSAVTIPGPVVFLAQSLLILRARQLGSGIASLNWTWSWTFCT